MPESLLDERHLSRPEFLYFRASMRPENPHTRAALDVVLPFIRVGMPVHFAQRAGLQVHDHAHHRLRYRKIVRVHDALFAARPDVRSAFEQPEFMRALADYGVAVAKRRLLARRYPPRRNVRFAFRQSRNGPQTQTAVARQNFRRHLRKPVCDAERPKLRKMS